MALDVRDTWDFNEPAESEKMFRSLLSTAVLSRPEQLEVLAQIARTFSLRRECDQCHAILDKDWSEAVSLGGRPKASFELERGRAFRTDKDVAKAIPFFETAAQSEVDDLKIDALHMLAIVAEPEESIRINREALGVAKQSTSLWANRWQGTLYNNLGWTLFEQERFDEALNAFESALSAREIYGPIGAVRIAKWCVGRCLRAQGLFDKALVIQTGLLGDYSDGYVDEEMGELLLATGKGEEAKPFFARAVEKLSDELGADSVRLLRLKGLR
jgi:tetratricopeptide (TPR) repeat protein